MNGHTAEFSGRSDVRVPPRSRLADPYMVVVCVAALKLGLHLYAGRHYGYFVDELYYLACSNHLDWGYVDQPPLIAFLTKIVHLLLGDSLPAIRLLPALAGAGTVLLTGLIAHELGGGRFAQGIAALAVLVGLGFLATDNLLSMNAFEPLFWAGSAYVLIRVIKTAGEHSPRRTERALASCDVSLATDFDDAATDAPDMAGGALVLPIP